MATIPTLPETQESIKEEIRRQVCELSLCCSPKEPTFALTCLETDDGNDEDELLFTEYFLEYVWSSVRHMLTCQLSQNIMERA